MCELAVLQPKEQKFWGSCVKDLRRTFAVALTVCPDVAARSAGGSARAGAGMRGYPLLLLLLPLMAVQDAAALCNRSGSSSIVTYD